MVNLFPHILIKWSPMSYNSAVTKKNNKFTGNTDKRIDNKKMIVSLSLYRIFVLSKVIINRIV